MTPDTTTERALADAFRRLYATADFDAFEDALLALAPTHDTTGVAFRRWSAKHVPPALALLESHEQVAIRACVSLAYEMSAETPSTT